jgi:hypothetical protein
MFSVKERFFYGTLLYKGNLKLSLKNYIMKSSGRMWFRYNYKSENV